ncbi:hypothetical protein N7468_000103 [Penicillium chermesinum]|uniref:Actin binding protein n=1 Tax=Penicillium chermesinum TaxID=63820 RepID=A0A9W9PJP4_9EURO|nr:uncharacterized protein N7468_000103 [Penicillium chermesinum]KAJ5248652.1 hypothetical protein N7468_000103 [Penicillium chermesinum]
MASLNLSTNGPSISKSYQTVVNATLPNGSSPTYGQWAVFSVSTPLVNAFQQDSANKESVLKVQASGEGELLDLIEEFSEGRIQFAYVKVTDPNTALPKNVLIAWCGEGVPERTKGYFTSHLASVSKFLHSRKHPPPAAAPRPPVASKPVFTPTRSGGVASAPSISRPKPSAPDDDDGWGADAPPITRTQLEKVKPAYQPTKVNLQQLKAENQSPASRQSTAEATNERDDVVRGGYQPIGKVDIAAIRRQAAESGQMKDDRPTPVKGSYEPVGKVDIAAIRSRAQKPGGSAPLTDSTPISRNEPTALPERPAANAERLTDLPKPKVANRFGSGPPVGGTKPPLPAGPGVSSSTANAQIGSASRTFANQGGKTPAQLWAERKARERGETSETNISVPPPIQSQASGQNEWKSSYAGKSWAPVQTVQDRPAPAQPDVRASDPLQPESSAPSEVATAREKFSREPPATPPIRESSPIQIAVPVSQSVSDAHEEQHAPPPALPVESLQEAVPKEEDLEEDHHDLGRAAAEATVPVHSQGGLHAVVQYDYEKAEDNEIDLREGEVVTEIEMVDEDWWLGVNAQGERGLFPGNYVEIAADGEVADAHTAAHAEAEPESVAEPEPVSAPPPPAASGHDSAPASQGATAAALYDYEAAEDNEISFPEGATITNVEFPDEDWWLGEYEGQRGLFPANYVQLHD